MEKTAIDVFADRCIEHGIITEEDLSEVVRDGHVLSSYSIGDNVYTTMFLGWNRKKKDLVQYVKEDLVPPLGSEYMFPVFLKYGYTKSGLCDGWVWYPAALDNAPESDLWQMVALSFMYHAGRKKYYDLIRGLEDENE